LYSILRAIIVGFLQITSDYLLKPVLAVVFNGFLQPQFIFVQNIFQSICSMLGPLTKLMGNVVKPFTECVRAFRVVEVKNINRRRCSVDGDSRDHQQQQQQQPAAMMTTTRTPTAAASSSRYQMLQVPQQSFNA